MPEVIMPRLSDTMEEGVLSRWLKKEGDTVRSGDVIGEIDTDKATMDLEAFDDGVLEKLLVPEGTTVAIGQPLAIIGDGSGSDSASDGASFSASDGASTTERSPADLAAADAPGQGTVRGSTGSESGAKSAPESAPESAPPQTVAPHTVVPGAAGEHAAGQPRGRSGVGGPGPLRVLTSPLARRIAVQHGLDPATITGTGPGGRIVRADVEAAVAAAAQPAQPAPSVGAAGATTEASGTTSDSLEIPLTQMRKVTARRLTESVSAPHFYLTNVVEVDRLFAFRAEINERTAVSGFKVSVTDLLVRACAVTLRAHPQVNSSWAGDKILQHRRINIGVAVALDDGLMVPVLTEADTKGLAQIAQETRALAEKARAGRLTLQEFSGGTFTISNLGMFGIDNFTAVINPPEAAILAVGAATEEPMVTDGELRTRRIMKITMTADHRVLDGATAAAFLQVLKQTLEDPLRIVI